MTPQELPIPLVAANDQRDVELLRVWAASTGQHFALPGSLWNDPGSWGIMLVAIARHVAKVYALSRGDDRAEALARIRQLFRQLFDVDWENPTDSPSGEVLGVTTANPPPVLPSALLPTYRLEVTGSLMACCRLSMPRP